jgi:hypothetical protein
LTIISIRLLGAEAPSDEADTPDGSVDATPMRLMLNTAPRRLLQHRHVGGEDLSKGLLKLLEAVPIACVY